MTNLITSKNAISALQNGGGYLRVSILDNPLKRIYSILSWLFVATSAFLQISNHYLAGYMPLTPIGTSSEPHRRNAEETQGEYIRDV